MKLEQNKHYQLHSKGVVHEILVSVQYILVYVLGYSRSSTTKVQRLNQLQN